MALVEVCGAAVSTLADAAREMGQRIDARLLFRDLPGVRDNEPLGVQLSGTLVLGVTDG
eukprot:gene43991-25284_t